MRFLPALATRCARGMLTAAVAARRRESFRGCAGPCFVFGVLLIPCCLGPSLCDTIVLEGRLESELRISKEMRWTVDRPLSRLTVDLAMPASFSNGSSRKRFGIFRSNPPETGPSSRMSRTTWATSEENHMAQFKDGPRGEDRLRRARGGGVVGHGEQAVFPLKALGSPAGNT